MSPKLTDQNALNFLLHFMLRKFFFRPNPEISLIEISKGRPAVGLLAFDQPYSRIEVDWVTHSRDIFIWNFFMMPLLTS